MFGAFYEIVVTSAQGSFLVLVLAKCRAIASYMNKALVLMSLKALVP